MCFCKHEYKLKLTKPQAKINLCNTAQEKVYEAQGEKVKNSFSTLLSSTFFKGKYYLYKKFYKSKFVYLNNKINYR